MLELKNIVLSRGKHKVLDGVNAEASAGRVIALLGENGTGKTTLLNCICGMLKCDSGEIFSGNKAVDPESDEWKEKISYVLDEGSAIPLLTVDEQLRLQCLLSGIGKSEASKRADHIISLLNLEKHRDYRAEELSAGLRKKLGIGLGLIRNAEIYLFDEPFSSLDVYSASDLSRLLGILKRRGRTVILSTHSPSFISSLCDQIWMLADGRITDYHEPSEIKHYMESPEEELNEHDSPDMIWIGKTE